MRPAIFTRKSSMTIVLLIITYTLNAQQLAFPTAEGYGKFAKGGRGGKVYEVISLKGTGSGSLGEALAAKGPRTVVFRVSGTIEASYKLSVSGETITAHITITVADKSNLQLEIFNMNGKRVALPVNYVFDADNHSIDISNLNLNFGLYLYKIKTAGKSAVGKMFIKN